MNQPHSQSAPRQSIAIIVIAWLILQFTGIFSPGLLDDVDSIYIEIAREMLHRHDFVTPYIDGIRFFDKPPLMYWLAAGSMRLFGEHDWAARLPLAFAVLALFFSTYALGRRLFLAATPAYSDRAALYATLALATSIGPYLYTRFFIPDILLCLWMTLGVHTFLRALDHASTSVPRLRRGTIGPKVGIGEADHTPLPTRNSVILSERRSLQSKDPDTLHPAHKAGIPSPFASRLLLPLPSRGPRRAFLARWGGSSLFPVFFAAILALNLLTKGFIGLVFPLAFAFLYLLLTRQLGLLRRLHPLAPLATFLAIALPWHILAALRNPPIPMPSGQGLPARAGWAWFYLYNEHIARFLQKRIPHDYGQTPIWLFWLYAIIWMLPWAAFLPAAVARAYRHLGHRFAVTVREREAALVVTLWSLTVVVFFTLSARQEYYSLPALPALALLLGGFLAHAESAAQDARAALNLHRYLLRPLSTLAAVVCLYFAITAPTPAPGATLAQLLSQNPELYNLSLGHLFDLTGAAMGLFRGPLLTVAAGMLTLGLVSYHLRRRTRPYAANLTLAAGMVLVLLAMHSGLVRFNPILGSKPLADAILTEQQAHPAPDDLILPDVIILDGELTTGSTLLFYTRQPVHLVNGRVNGPWFGSFYPDAPAIFEDESTLRTLWSSPRRVFLLTYNPTQRLKDLAPARALATAGGKTILTNH